MQMTIQIGPMNDQNNIDKNIQCAIYVTEECVEEFYGDHTHTINDNDGGNAASNEGRVLVESTPIRPTLPAGNYTDKPLTDTNTDMYII